MKTTKEFDLDSNERDQLELTGVCPQCHKTKLKKEESSRCSIDTHWENGKWIEDEHVEEEKGWQHYSCTNCDFDYEINR